MKSVLQYALITIVILFFLQLNMFASNPYSHGDSTAYQANYQKLQYKIGFNLGFEHPYSGGLEFSVLFNELIDINMGVGLGFSGAKIGIGSRVFPMRNNRLSPLFGAFLYHSTGLGELNVSINNDSAKYKITADNALLLNTGGRIRFGKGHYLVGSLGYSIPFTGDKAFYISGSTDPSLKTMADIFGTGGFSIDFGLILKLTKGHYRVQNRGYY